MTADPYAGPADEIGLALMFVFGIALCVTALRADETGGLGWLAGFYASIVGFLAASVVVATVLLDVLRYTWSA